MTVATFLQDPLHRGGIATVVGWYRKWMEANRPGENREFHFDDFSGHSSFLPRAIRWDPSQGAIPRLMPRLHFPQYYAGRVIVRRLATTYDESHVIGAAALHGALADREKPSLLWIATTIGDERRRVVDHHTRVRSWLHRSTLPFLEHIEKGVLDNATKIMPMSPHTADCLVKLGVPAQRVEVSPVPIDTDIFKPGDGDRNGVLFVGRAGDPRKNFDVVARLVEASPVVRACGLDVVSPTGDPPRWMHADYHASVRWQREADDLPEVYRSAQVFTLSSRQEGYGIVVFEALASGTPVVAFRCGGPDKFLMESGGGFLVNDFDEMQAAVEKLLHDPSLREDMGTAGREWVEKNISAKKFLSDPSIFTT